MPGRQTSTCEKYGKGEGCEQYILFDQSFIPRSHFKGPLSLLSEVSVCFKEGTRFYFLHWNCDWVLRSEFGARDIEIELRQLSQNLICTLEWRERNLLEMTPSGIPGFLSSGSLCWDNSQRGRGECLSVGSKPVLLVPSFLDPFGGLTFGAG